MQYYWTLSGDFKSGDSFCHLIKSDFCNPLHCTGNFGGLIKREITNSAFKKIKIVKNPTTLTFLIIYIKSQIFQTSKLQLVFLFLNSFSTT